MEHLPSIIGFIFLAAIVAVVVALISAATPEECKKCRFYGNCHDFIQKYHYPPCVTPTNKNK